MSTPPEPKADDKPADKPEKLPPPPIETQHEIKVGKQTLKYSVQAGMMAMKNDKDEHKGNIFYTAYTLNDVSDKGRRPLTFVFNGGPGSASVWLHLGALGPYRVKMQDQGWMPAPPYQLVENPHTWLDVTDLVFVDPVGTGYSHPIKEEDSKEFWSLKGDLKWLTEFIRIYLNRAKRWNSPLFLAGESYGTTRVAGLTQSLLAKGIALNGIMLISSVLNFQTLDFVQGNDLVYPLFLPTYTATARYHQRLSPSLQTKPINEVLAEVEAWAQQEYTVALMRGDRLSTQEQHKIAKKLALYTGLSSEYVLGAKLRINIHRFCKELLRGQNLNVGRLDSRFRGYEELTVTEYPEFDPSMVAIIPPYTALMTHYVSEKLGYTTDAHYEVLNFNVGQGWEWEKGNFPDTSAALREALHRNPFMQVWVGQGYYDLATPHLAALYTFNHMGLNPELPKNFHVDYYEAGHMFYVDTGQLAKFKGDIAAFVKRAVR